MIVVGLVEVDVGTVVGKDFGNCDEVGEAREAGYEERGEVLSERTPLV